MAPANRMPMSDMRKLALAGLIVLGVFLLFCGAGMSSIAVGSIGVILAVGGPILIFGTTLRGNVRSYVFGTARVVEISPPPQIGPSGRGELGLVIHARGIDGVAVRVRDPAIPLNKWPQIGATLPVRSVTGSPRKTIVLWADVRTHDETTYDDRLNPEYADLSDEERGSNRDEDEDFDHGPLPPDDTPTVTDIPLVPATDGSADGEPGASERPASVAVAERRRPSPRPRKPVHDEVVAVAAAEPIVQAATAEPDAVADADSEPQDAIAEPELAEPEEAEAAEAEPEVAEPEVAEPEAAEPEPDLAEPEAVEAETLEAETVEAETVEAPVEAPAEPESTEEDVVEDPVEAAATETAETTETTDAEPDTYEPGPEAFATLQAHAPVIDERSTQESVIGPGDVEREIIAPNPYATDVYVPAPDPVPANGPRHRAPDLVELLEPEPDTDPADVLEEEVPLGAVAEFLPATPQRRPVPLEGVNGVSVTLIVSDLQRSLRFYRETLGLTEVDSNGGSAVLASGDARVVLRRSADMPPVDRRVVHLNLEVPDVYEAYERLKAEGVEFVHRPRVVPQGEQLDLCTATFRDPDGHAISLTRWELRR